MKISPKTTLATIPFLASALLGCKSSPITAFAKSATQSVPGRTSLQSYERVAHFLDNPEEIFRKANYKPTWTVEAQEAVIRFDNQPAVMPNANRVWEPWFRNSLKNGERVLTYAEILRLREAIGLAISHDPRTRWKEAIPGVAKAQLAIHWAQQIETVRAETLTSLGILQPSLPLLQITMADAAAYFVKANGDYGTELAHSYYKKLRKWPDATELLGQRRRMELDCSTSEILSKYMLREMEWQRKKAGKATGISCNVAQVSAAVPGKRVGGHAIFCVEIVLEGEKKAHLFYDATATGNKTRSFETSTNLSWCRPLMAPIDRASLEALAAIYCLHRSPALPKRLGLKPKQIDSRWEGGEANVNFSLGNYNYKPDLFDISRNLTVEESNSVGWKPWSSWREANKSSRDRFHQLVQDVHW